MRDLISGILAGIFLSLAAYASVIVGMDLPLGLSKLLTGIIFSTGLILIILNGCKLFTGQMLSFPSLQRFTARYLLETWSIVYIGNFIGCFIIFSLLPHVNIDGILQYKTSLTFLEIIKSGILCNILVCIASHLGTKFKGVQAIPCIVFPITIFIIGGYEHCVANMFYFLCGMEQYGLGIFLNLIPATIGNIIGGGALAFILRYLDKHQDL